MTNHDFDEKEKNFNLNALRLRDRVFGLRYTDVSAISALSQSTLSAYAPASNPVKVSPTLTIGKKIADMYCTTIEELTECRVYEDWEKSTYLLAKFIKRGGGVNGMGTLTEILDEASKKPTNERFLMETVTRVFSGIIKSRCEKGEYFVVENDKDIRGVFTENFRALVKNTDATYRMINDGTNLSLGSLSRLSGGAEPTLSAVVRIAGYFGVSITGLLSLNPGFDFEEINKTLSSPTVRTGAENAALQKKKKKDRLEVMDYVMLMVLVAAK